MTHGRQLIVFLVAVFAWTWGIAGLMVAAPEWVESTFGEMSATQPLFILAVYAPSLLSLVLTGVFQGRAGLRHLLSRLDPRRSRWWWWLLIPVGMILLSALAGLVASLLGLGPLPQFAGVSPLVYALSVMFLAEPGPLGEELGWRGFALPRLLERWSPLTSSLILGVIWAVWHLPAFFISGTPQQSLALPLFMIGAVALSVVATWVFVRTAGSVLLSILLHRMANGANDLTGVGFEVFAAGLMVVAIVLLLFGRMRDRAPAATMISEPPGS